MTGNESELHTAQETPGDRVAVAEHSIALKGLLAYSVKHMQGSGCYFVSDEKVKIL